MYRKLLLFLLFFSTLYSEGQNIPIYRWRSHMPFDNGIHLAEVGNKIFCGTTTGLFYVDKSDNSIHPLSKVDGFSDVFIKTLTYDAGHDILFIAYQDGNLDLLHHGKIINKSDFLKNNIFINSIYTYGDIAYICTSAPQDDAIYEMNLNAFDYELGERYNNNSPNGVNRVTILGDFLYACSDQGVKKVPLTVNKRDPSKWISLPADSFLFNDSCSNIVTFAGKVFASFKNGYLKYYDPNTSKWTTLRHIHNNRPVQSLENCNGILIMASGDSIFEYTPDLALTANPTPSTNHAIIDKDGFVWVARSLYGMLRFDKTWQNPGVYKPSGPIVTNGFNALGYHNEIWVSSGLIANNGAPGYTYNGFYMFDGVNWHNYNPGTPAPGDYLGMAKDTVTNHLWLASLDSGVVDFDPVTQNIKVYYYGNTGNILPHSQNIPYSTMASNVCFDKNDNLWACFYRTNTQLARRKPDGTWTAYKKGIQTQANGILADDFGYIWLIDSRENDGVVIFDPASNNTVTLTTTTGSGGLPSGNVNCITKDKGGQVWMGTSSGVCLYSDPSLLFSGRSYDVQRPYINNGPYQGYLLAAQNVNCIAVDGANRKWIGTSDGAYLTNADGDKVLLYFNADNSPLVSNHINAIAVNGVSGEVFFVTEKGIVSYKSTATDGGDHNQDVYAYPNPVKPGYSGPIAIKGLVNDANVKITDIAGQLVFETTALGGQAIWNGNNFSGKRANSGVYMVFITNTDGSETMITKIMIIR